MTNRHWFSVCKRLALSVLFSAIMFPGAYVARAHPLGNFTTNHFTRIEVGADQIRLHYVIDMAEIPTFQELQRLSVDGNSAPSNVELNEYAARVSERYKDQLLIFIDDALVALRVLETQARLSGTGGLQTMRVECDLVGAIPASGFEVVHRLRFEDHNYSDRIGWREVVVSPLVGISVFNSSAYSNSISEELKAYPDEMFAAPLDERVVHLSFTRAGIPAGAQPLLVRNGNPAATTRDRLAELIAVPQLTVGVMLFGLLIAVLLGGLHALSPGHGKTVVGAYLVGSRGNARHALFLGLTVTITHTAGVFALGVVTLLASQYIVPEQLFPVLSLLSGAIVVTMGASLLIRRVRAAIGWYSHDHAHDGHSEDEHDLHHSGDARMPHSHGGRFHSHLPPGADGSPVSWRSLLALGISGGILPCPSALVVLLAAISLHRVGYGLLLVIAFSAGLAGVLTTVGLAFVYAGRLLKSSGGLGRLARVLPVLSALVITCAGIAICYQALGQAGLNISSLTVPLTSVVANVEPSFISVSVFGVLGLGLLFGLKHATEVDHIVAISTIVSEQRRLTRAAIVGGLWGAGHTASLVIVGGFVLVLRIAIPTLVASWLEFGVALMIIGLGVVALRRAFRSRADVHIHKHDHGNRPHAHIHFHDADYSANTTQPHSHAVARVGLKPTLVGAMHGLAGSGALTLLVLTQINSSALGFLYLGVFGVGSILGMLLMSGLIGLPFVLSSRKLSGIHYRVQMIAGGISIAFGILYAYETGIATGLMKSLGTVLVARSLS
jgi:ABC-type nickel/cobalt efflux system permease component RcnA